MRGTSFRVLFALTNFCGTSTGFGNTNHVTTSAQGGVVSDPIDERKTFAT